MYPKELLDNIPSPCYVLEEAKLIRNLEKLQQVKERAGVKIILALKAYALWHTFPLIRQYLDGATASSINEARLIHEFMGDKAHTYAPVYSNEDFEEFSKISSHITFNSLTQFEQFKGRLKDGIEYGLRINPEVQLSKTEMYDPCAPGSRLGITAKQLPDVLPKEISGLHVHALCENGVAELKQVLEALKTKFDCFLSQIKWLNLGGGHLITAKRYDTEELIRVLTDFKAKHPLEIIMEPGSAIAWETGFLKATVLDIVENKGIKTAVLDVSFTAHMPDTLEMPYKPAVVGEVDLQKATHVYRFGGNSCLSGDFVPDFCFDKELKPRDTVLFLDMMHYTTVKTTMFNGVHHPAIGMIDISNYFQILRKFVYTDFKSRLG